MTLVDTSIWIDHLRVGNARLAAILKNSEVLTHPCVIGELACGDLNNRREILALLNDLPQSAVASHDETLYFIERHRLMGRGIGYIDAQLLAATSLEGTSKLWTRDKRLRDLTKELSLYYERG